MSRSKSKTILIISIAFLPNIGGVETHLWDLVTQLKKNDWRVLVLTYQPLHTATLGKWLERLGNITIVRLPSIPHLFYKLQNIPLLEFLFLCPLQFVVTPIILLFYPKVAVINAQGLIAGFSASFWSKVFGKKYIAAAQSLYHFPKKGIYYLVAKWIFGSADTVLVQTERSKKDIASLGIPRISIKIFTQWEDTSKFYPYDKLKAKKIAGFEGKFVVSFFGRLVKEKGVIELLRAIRLVNHRIHFAIYGEGPLVDKVLQATKEMPNVTYMGVVPPESLPLHYSAADVVVMPSIQEEPFGKVAVGALLCGTPVVASNRGALPQVVNDQIGKIIKPIPQKIASAINDFYNKPLKLRKSSTLAKKYAKNKFSERNAEKIISSFKI